MAILLIILVIWFALAGWVSSIAASKGRSQGAWFVLGLCFGLIALLIVACLSTDPNARPTGRYVTFPDAKQPQARTRYRKQLTSNAGSATLLEPCGFPLHNGECHAAATTAIYEGPDNRLVDRLCTAHVKEATRQLNDKHPLWSLTTVSD